MKKVLESERNEKSVGKGRLGHRRPPGGARRVEDGDQEENAETLSGQPDAKSGVLEPGLAVDVGLGVVSTRLVFKAM